MEIQIEGENGWAAKLPTWRVKNPLKIISGWPEITGYHLFLWLTFIAIFHFPFFLGFPLTLANELLVIEVVYAFLFIEDFFWFVFNPGWGLKKFFSQKIPWHADKFLFLPQSYWLSFAIIIILEFLRRLA